MELGLSLGSVVSMVTDSQAGFVFSEWVAVALCPLVFYRIKGFSIIPASLSGSSGLCMSVPYPSALSTSRISLAFYLVPICGGGCKVLLF